jgi:hypothetical protein
VAAGPLRGGKMCLQLTDDEGRQPDDSPAGARLGRAGDQPALDLGEDLGHGDRPGRQIDPALAEPGQLPDPPAAVGAHEHQCPVAGMDHLGQVDDLGGVRKRISSRSIFGSGTLRQGVAPGFRAVAVQLRLSAVVRRRMDPYRPAGGPHSAELGRDGEHSWTRAVKSRSSCVTATPPRSLTWPSARRMRRRSAQVGMYSGVATSPGTGQAIRFPAR